MLFRLKALPNKVSPMSNCVKSVTLGHKYAIETQCVVQINGALTLCDELRLCNAWCQQFILQPSSCISLGVTDWQENIFAGILVRQCKTLPRLQIIIHSEIPCLLTSDASGRLNSNQNLFRPSTWQGVPHKTYTLFARFGKLVLVDNEFESIYLVRKQDFYNAEFLETTGPICMQKSLGGVDLPKCFFILIDIH